MHAIHSRLNLPILMILTLVLSSCGKPAPTAEVAQQAPSATAAHTTTATPRHPAATATARPATPTARPPTATALPPTAEPTSAPLPAPTAALVNATAVVRNGGNVRRVPATGEPLDQVHTHATVQALVSFVTTNLG